MPNNIDYGTEKTCAHCGKSFLVWDVEAWVYKKFTAGNIAYFHTWSCMRAWQKERDRAKYKLASDYGHTIKNARKRLGMSRVALADMLGVSIATVGNWEQMYTKPSKKYQELVENRLGIDLGRKENES